MALLPKSLFGKTKSRRAAARCAAPGGEQPDPGHGGGHHQVDRSLPTHGSRHLRGSAALHLLWGCREASGAVRSKTDSQGSAQGAVATHEPRRSGAS